MDERSVIKLHTARAIKQMRNASRNLSFAEEIGAVPPTARLLTVLASSIELWGARNRGQVESALADYFDALVDDPPNQATKDIVSDAAINAANTYHLPTEDCGLPDGDPDW
tara:strand:+ start:263 stop:595 length:333 start_codon:yes stop_codon:yes gene_type:complete